MSFFFFFFFFATAFFATFFCDCVCDFSYGISILGFFFSAFSTLYFYITYYSSGVSIRFGERGRRYGLEKPIRENSVLLETRILIPNVCQVPKTKALDSVQRVPPGSSGSPGGGIVLLVQSSWCTPA